MSLTDTLRHARGPVSLRARWVLPIDLPPIENGEVVYEDGRILWVGPARRDTATIDLGNSALLPGLVNVHCHLEYTVLRGMVEDVPFFPWIRTLTALKAFLTHEDWVASATLGAAEMAAAGITMVGEACDAGAAVSGLIAAGLRGIAFREAFGIEAEPPVATTIDVLRRRLTEMRTQIVRAGAEERIDVGISPHAPYTVRPELLAALGQLAQREGVLQAIHLAESPAEEALFRAGSGPFKEMFDRRKIRWELPPTSPIQHAADSGALEAPALAVHCVHAGPDDALTLVRKNASVAHCPRSNGKLGAGWAPVRMLRAAGLHVGLGTDSMVSANSVDFFEEMRSAVYGARAREQDVGALSADDALKMATIEGAKALRREREIGSLAVGKRADLCVVRLDGLHLAPAADDAPIAALVYSARASDVALTIGDGQVIYDNGRFPNLDVARLRHSVAAARRRVRTEGAKHLGPT